MHAPPSRVPSITVPIRRLLLAALAALVLLPAIGLALGVPRAFATAGIVLGMIGAYGISLLLMRSYELPRLPLVYLPIGALVLWALGQIAVFAPARRAAALPPVAALRGG